jgi:nuclear transport factor 2 (NTF2) superfamily protein
MIRKDFYEHNHCSPFTSVEQAVQKVQIAEDLWNTGDRSA